MSPRVRLVLLCIAGLVLCIALSHMIPAMPRFGEPVATRYADAVNEIGPRSRHVSNEVSAVNFDFRGIDTLGEEYMLLGAVTGAVLLLRGSRGERSRDAPHPGRTTEPRSDAVVLLSRLLGPLILLFGFYVALHATVTPGGGFQGGVIAASGLLLVYVGDGYVTWRALVQSKVLDVLEGAGALIFALAALVPMFLGEAALTNILPLGTLGTIDSGGLMLVENVGVFLAVGSGFAQLFIEFLEETREVAS